MPQLRLKLTLDKRLTAGAMRRRRKKLLKRFEKQLAYKRRQALKPIPERGIYDT